MNKGVHAIGSRLKGFFIRTRMRQLQDRAWRERHRKVFDLHPEYKTPCVPDVEQQHTELWRRLRRRVKPDTLRICKSISGSADPRIVPEEIYAAEVEPALNRHEVSRFLGNKSVYDRWFGQGIFPHCFLHNIQGVFYDAEYNRLGEE